jgi:hypothetical protein
MCNVKMLEFLKESKGYSVYSWNCHELKRPGVLYIRAFKGLQTKKQTISILVPHNKEPFHPDP